MNKKAQAFDTEVFFSPGFWILTGVGLIAFLMMLAILKGMNNSSIMPTWVKIVTIVIIPIAAYLFTLINANQ